MEKDVTQEIDINARSNNYCKQDEHEKYELMLT